MRVWIVSRFHLMVLGVVLLAAAAAAAMLIMGGQPAQTTTAAAAGEYYELDVPAGRQKVLPVYSVERQDKKIALTIDAAWEDDKTPFILKELEKQGVKATFYLCGFWVEKYPDMVKAIFDAGHELGNHTATHPHLTQLGEGDIQKELQDFEEKVKAITGQNTRTFRAPYGEYDERVVKTINDMGYPVIQWSVDTIDWKQERSADTILESVLPRLAPGCIILCHNNGFTIEEYLPTLISRAKEQGYEFVTVSQLLLEGETFIDVNGVQKRA